MNEKSPDALGGTVRNPTAEAGGTPTLRTNPLRSRLGQRILRTALAIVLGALLLETTCWLIRDYVLPPKWSKNPDTDRMEPGFDGTIDYADTVEGRGARLGQLHVNSFGLRGPEPRLSNEHAPDRLRVYCLGSSTTFGWGASSDDTTYPAQLERILKERWPQRQIEVINAGIPGNNSESELKILKEDLPRLKPDIVIIWSGWPDWTHYLQPEGRKRQSDSDWLDPLRKTNSYRLAEYVRDMVTPRPKPPAFEEFTSRKSIEKFRDGVLKKWKANLAEMYKACDEQHARIVVLGLPSPLRAPVESWDSAARQQAANRMLAMKDASPSDLPRSIADFERELGLSGNSRIDHVPGDTLPCDSALYFDGVHMKDEGYRALAQAVAAALK